MRRSGSITIATILSLMIAASCLPPVYLCFSLLSGMETDYSLMKDEISMSQLRRILLIGYDRVVNSDYVSFIYHGDQYVLHMVNSNLILQPGTQIFLKDVDHVEFYKDAGCLVVCYRRKDKEYESIIAQEECLYLADFSCDPDECVTDSAGE